MIHEISGPHAQGIEAFLVSCVSLLRRVRPKVID